VHGNPDGDRHRRCNPSSNASGGPHWVGCDWRDDCQGAAVLCPKHEAMPGGVEGAALCLILVRDHAKHAGKAWLPAGVVLTADPEMFFASMPEIIYLSHPQS